MAAKSPDDPLTVYLAHARRVCEYVLRQGKTPLLWADMFWRQDRLDLVHAIPREAILVDWQYNGRGPFATTIQLAARGHAVMGASAIRCGYDLSRALPPLELRFESIFGWHRELAEGRVIGLIHTNWGRGRSLLPLYGPWQGCIPCFRAAASPKAQAHDALRPFVPRLDTAMGGNSPQACEELSRELEQLSLTDEMSEQCRAWWRLALQHRAVTLQVLSHALFRESCAVTSQHRGPDTEYRIGLSVCGRQLVGALARWEREARVVWRRWELSDENEFIESRTEPWRRLLAGR